MTSLPSNHEPVQVVDLPSDLHGRRVLVTGAAGFIGSHIVTALVGAGARAYGLDIRNAPPDFAGDGWIQSDVLSVAPNHIEDIDPDIVIHLASIVGVEAAAGDEEATWTTIVDGTRKLLEATDSTRPRQFVYVSSSEVYGETHDIPITETTPLQPRSSYARAKAAAEEVVRAHAVSTGTPTLIIRPFNVYGPGQRPDFVVSRFVTLAAEGQALTLIGDGLQIRMFTHVDDFVSGLLGARASCQSGLYNIAGSEAWTIEAVARRVLDEVGGGTLVFGVHPSELGRPPADEVRHRIASTAKAAKDFGFVPRVTLADGIRRMVQAGVGESCAVESPGAITA